MTRGEGRYFEYSIAEADHRIAKLRVITGDDDATRPDQHQPAGHNLALHGGDGRLGNVPPAFTKSEPVVNWDG